jgi:hypothetical protein
MEFVKKNTIWGDSATVFSNGIFLLKACITMRKEVIMHEIRSW